MVPFNGVGGLPLIAAWAVTAADRRTGGQEAKTPAACRIEAALLSFGLAVGEQRPAVIADEVENDLLDRLSPQAAIHLQSADHLAAENPDVVTVLPQGRARQRLGQQVA
jgi:hypothetical protein